MVQLSLDFGGVILTAAALSFLGLGRAGSDAGVGAHGQPGPVAVRDGLVGRDVPGLAILITALAFNLLGDGLRTVLDPRQVMRDRDS